MSAGKPRLTYLITGLQFGGANIGMVRLLSELSADEFDVTVVSVARTDPDVVPLLPDHVDVVRCEMDSKLGIHRLRPLVGILRETDVLVCSLFHATMVGAILGRVLRVPTILVWHHSTNHPNSLRPIGYRVANRVADRILADSDSVERLLAGEYDVGREDVSVLPIVGIDTDEFSPGDREAHTGEELRIATAGRLSEAKGYPDLLSCARTLGSDYQFHVAGDGPERDRLVERSPENVTFHGKLNQEEMPSFYRCADVYFQPSRWEGLCMTVIEAMACGLPVVASAVGGITESVVDGETGILCPSGDVECFRTALEGLANDPERRHAMGAAGRERVIGRYSAEVLVAGFREAVALARTPAASGAGGETAE